MATFRIKKGIIALLVCFIVIASSTTYYYFVMLPLIKSITASKIKSVATSAVNNAVFYALTEKTDYNNLVTVYSDNYGKINMISANSVKINALARETSKFSQEYINKIGDGGVDIPMGSLTGFEPIVGQGPLIHFKTVPVGTVNADFYSEFTSCGINQTRHRIYIIVEATIDVILPVKDEEIVTNTQVLVSESIIVGEVPDTYLKLNGEAEYNLLPNNLT